MTVTALPVLGRILEERRLLRTRIGCYALTVAALTDLVIWCVLAVCLGLLAGHATGQVAVAVGAVAFVAVLLGVVRPVAARLLADRSPRPGGDRPVLGLVVCGALLSAAVTEALGLHAVFGAFLFGLVLPRRSAVVAGTMERVAAFSTPVLLPMFFAQVGLQTDLSMTFTSGAGWLLLPALACAAVAGKVGSAYAAARLAGWPPGEAGALGFLLNCRGVTELIVLTVGLGQGVITPALFSAFVVMTAVTTLMAAPLAVRLLAGTGQRADQAADQTPVRPRVMAT
jgi:Kef-type K+ transport system membrane component KefB